MVILLFLLLVLGIVLISLDIKNIIKWKKEKKKKTANAIDQLVEVFKNDLKEEEKTND